MEAQLHETLENPFWAALTTTHAEHALTLGELKRFAPDVAPFCAVAHADADIGVAQGCQPGELMYFLGTVPALPRGWTVLPEGSGTVLQMVYERGVPDDAELADAAQQLFEQDKPSMLALTGLVYPEYFRPHTARLGKYFGRYQDGSLIAMAGQRMASTGYREISAVCTHPAHTGQGHARRLIRQLTRAILEEGRTPFLHVSASNVKARALYEELGFAASRELRLAKVRTT